MILNHSNNDSSDLTYNLCEVCSTCDCFYCISTAEHCQLYENQHVYQRAKQLHRTKSVKAGNYF